MIRPFRHSQHSLQLSYPRLQLSYPLLQLRVLGVLRLKFFSAGRTRTSRHKFAACGSSHRPIRVKFVFAGRTRTSRHMFAPGPRHGVFVTLAGRIGHAYQYGLVGAKTISLTPITRREASPPPACLPGVLGTMSSNAWTRVAASVWALVFCR